MKTQQAGQENTLLEMNIIPEEMDIPPGPRAPPGLPRVPTHCFQGMASVARVMGLLVLGLMLGFFLSMVIYQPAGKQDPGPQSPTEKVYVTGSLKESGDTGRYEIFTAARNAHYFIYVHVRHLEKNNKGRVYLEHCWQKSPCMTIKNIIHSEDSYIVPELQLFKGSRVILLFNERNDEPDQNESFFHIFEIQQKGNGHT